MYAAQRFVALRGRPAPANPPVSWTFTYSGNTIGGTPYTGAAGTQTASSGALADGVMTDTTTSAWGDDVSNPSFIIADFGSVKTVSTVRVAPIGGWGAGYFGGSTMTLEFSTDGSTWTNPIVTTGVSTGVLASFAAGVSARYVRLQRAGQACNCSEFWFT